MEEKDRQELEDLLFEAREEEEKAKLSKGNQKLLIGITIVVLINFILFPFDYQRIRTEVGEALGVALAIQGLILPLGSLAVALFASLFRFGPPRYRQRLYRSFLFFYLLSIIFLLFILIANAIVTMP